MILIISFIIGMIFSKPIFARYYEKIDNISVRGIIDESYIINNKEKE